MKKKLLSFLLAAAMLCSMIPAAFAASDEALQAANNLNALGLFSGVGTNADGTPNYDLDRTPTRHEAITMLVNLLGKGEEARAGTWETPFTDVAEWAKPYVGYAYCNGLTSGTSATTYSGNDPVSVSQYLTFVLKVLGYDASTDFQWNKAWELSDRIQLTDGRYNADTKNFTRGDVAIISAGALLTELKTENTTLLKTLMKAGAVPANADKVLKAHDWDKGKVKAPATCTATGIMLYTCKDCGYTRNAVIPVLAHDFQPTQTADINTCTAMICTTCGATNGVAQGHNYAAATCTAPQICTVCGAATGSALGHNFGETSCYRCGVANPAYVPPTLVYSDKRVNIRFLEVTARGVVFEVDNKTTATITIQADSIAINKHSTEDIIMSDDVSPMSTGTVFAKCSGFDVSKGIGEISGQLRVIDFDRSFSSYDAPFSAVTVNSSVPVSDPEITGTKVYSDKRVEIFFVEADSTGVYFDVVNKTNVNITIQADAVSINGRSTEDIIMSDNVAPLSTGTVKAKCGGFNANDAVATISGQLRIIDFNKSFSTYDAPFVNVKVDENAVVGKTEIDGTLVYSDNRVNIYYYEMDASGVSFMVENKTNVTVTIQADAIAVNGISTDDIIMSDDVAPKSTGIVKAKCSIGVVPSSVYSVSGFLRVIDFNKSFSTYSARFINIPVS